MGLKISRSAFQKPKSAFQRPKSLKSAFQIPHHVAIQIFDGAAPRGFSAENSGPCGDGFPHSAEKK